MNTFLRVITALNAADVRYVIVGGFAAFLHGSRRVTFDLDIVVDLRPAEARKAVAAMLGAGFKARIPVDPYEFADETRRTAWVREKNMVVFTFFDPMRPGFAVDFFVESPIDFELLASRALRVEIETQPVKVCAIDDLIELKLLAGRPQDVQDVEALRGVRSLQDGKSQ